MESAWDDVAQAISMLLARHIPPASTRRMHRALHNLRNAVDQLNPQEGYEMSSPTPDMRSIDQNDINEWAANVQAAATAIQAVIANGNLQKADESALNTALGNLDGVAGTSTPPAPTPPDTPPASA